MRFACLIVAVVSLVLSSSLADAQSEKPKSPNGALAVIDGNGTVVGPLLGPNSVGIRIEGVWFQATVLHHVLRPQGGEKLNYESADCSSEPLLQVSNVPEFLAGYLADAQTETYGYLYATDIRDRTVVSYALIQGDGSPGACTPFEVPHKLPSGVAKSIALPYVPPFSVK